MKGLIKKDREESIRNGTHFQSTKSQLFRSVCLCCIVYLRIVSRSKNENQLSREKLTNTVVSKQEVQYSVVTCSSLTFDSLFESNL